MIKKLTLYLGTLLLLVSCYTFNKPKKPDHFLSKKEMVNIILDLRIIASANGSNQILLQNQGIYSEDYVYKKYNIDSATFALNNHYYAFYVNDYDDIYNKVKDSLEVLKTTLEALSLEEEAQKRKTDSINNQKKRDSLNLLKTNDSLKLLPKKDSIFKVKFKEKIKPKLIEPVSETTLQSQ
ncbi:MAG: DUF4296 domain-containing protein [Flavobacteriales bacterium]|nr:DUF4296 domain-containing protein [Flavobacteriia bacterium]NCP04716.1 DUF4296 domain-containing protein [Flavobacteriales bacterium]PIV94363.1 MAG: hypothetical protein COW44_04615 [Flavobacteriaceae bacterium CG17_big_fil_post_rev_8_21_14_2_50_33_15]PIY10475.1 MAG: hypothetical protein COZ17_09835 [Flavobacteriaceae bacterium CG_4_10_14_3_um_filter_33_47]PJB16644.1 MAG: hypothetical protein CO117_14630 [Flavobacteriaceae bacterium CG_4_9_14_3_um_filter_33_16]